MGHGRQPERGEAMWAMALEAVAAEVVLALEDAGVDSLLLKGPPLAEWLYEDPGARPYVDVDLLVDSACAGAARGVLAQRGFRQSFGPLPHPGMERPPSAPWLRDGLTVDLHETLPGARARRSDV